MVNLLKLTIKSTASHTLFTRLFIKFDQVKHVYLVIIDIEHDFIHGGDATVSKLQTKSYSCFVVFEIYFRMFYEMYRCSVHFIIGTHRQQKRIMVLLEGPLICRQVLLFLLLLFLLSLFSLQLVNVFLKSLFKLSNIIVQIDEKMQ